MFEPEQNPELFRAGMAKKGGIYRDFFGSSLEALRGLKDEDLLPRESASGEFTYSVEQGAKAACLAREDSAATFMVQFALLRRLRRIELAVWLSLATLAYIAWRLS